MDWEWFYLKKNSLLLLNGILSLTVMLFTLIRMNNFPEWKIIQGIVLIGWVAFEFFMINEPDALQLFYLVLAATILILGILSGRKHTNQSGNN